ncbi:hypothetical protein CXK93_10335 [Stutzerimonas decontaminans]|uniref:Uncharacterized protein n=1 Tax=Stutzerimonas decontaminans TaxID=3022791 RepID=A0ABX4VZX7_9GAMM|nr:hypothetical protein CXK93_10335 [Stutzerimonas decontaminans]
MLTGGGRGLLTSIFVALDAVAGVAINTEHARRIAAVVDVNVAGRSEAKGVLAAIGAYRIRRFDHWLANRFFHLVFVSDDLADGGFAAIGSLAQSD